MPRSRSSISPKPSANARAAEPVADGELGGIFAIYAGLRSIALAVSGGPDSLALLHLSLAWRAQVTGLRPDFIVLTVDHGLRPEAASEAAQVALAARELGLQARVLTRIAPASRTAIQAAARQHRYALLACAAREAGAEAIATGHTLDDQAETLLMRLARGSGIDGLSAMQPVSQIDALKLLRPLLGLPKARLEASLRARGLGWTVDPSNQNPSFERPRLRTLMPALIAAGLTPEAIATSARRLARGRAVLDQAAAQACRLFVGVHEAGYFEVDRHGFDQLAEDLRLRLLGRLLGRIGPPGAFERMARLELLMARLAAEPRLGLSLGGCLIQAGPDKILVLREPGREGLPRLTLSPGESADWDRRWRIDLSAGAPATIAVRALETADFQGEIAAAGKASGAPRKALLATPSAWSGSTLIAAPLLGLSSPEISFAALLSLDNLLAPRANDVATISEP